MGNVWVSVFSCQSSDIWFSIMLRGLCTGGPRDSHLEAVRLEVLSLMPLITYGISLQIIYVIIYVVIQRAVTEIFTLSKQTAIKCILSSYRTDDTCDIIHTDRSHTALNMLRSLMWGKNGEHRSWRMYSRHWSQGLYLFCIMANTVSHRALKVQMYKYHITSPGAGQRVHTAGMEWQHLHLLMDESVSPHTERKRQWPEISIQCFNSSYFIQSTLNKSRSWAYREMERASWVSRYWSIREMGWGLYLSFPIVKQPSGRKAAITNNTNHAFRLKVEIRNDGRETAREKMIPSFYHLFHHLHLL